MRRVLQKAYSLIGEIEKDDSGTKDASSTDDLCIEYVANSNQHEYDHLDGILYIDRGDKAFAEKTEAQFKKRAERAAQKAKEKAAKAAKIAAKIAAKEAKKSK